MRTGNGWSRRQALKGGAMALAALSTRGITRAAGGDEAQYVNPFIGTGAHGHTYPGATVPFGMVQLSPDSGVSGWDWCSGYHASSKQIVGFSHTHLSGTGIGDLCDVLFTPVVPRGQPVPASPKLPVSAEHEKASAGYYAVRFPELGLTSELTATERVGYHRHTFPETPDGEAWIVVNLAHAVNWDKPTDTRIRVEGPTTISGHRMSTGWARDQRLYFVAEFSQPFEAIDFPVEGARKKAPADLRGPGVRAALVFDTRRSKVVLARVAISACSIEGARANLKRESLGWDFDRVRGQARDSWNRELGRVRVQTGDAQLKEVFYTALYHSFLAPTLFCDADGSYLGPDGQTHPSPGFRNYTVFSLWDTFRAEHPLLTLVQPERVEDLVQSMLAFYRESGLLPVWTLMGNETNTMTGYHSIPVLLDAWKKGLTRAKPGELLEAMKKSALQDARGLRYYKAPESLGYVPADKEGESITKTLEYAFDDWCIARMAEAAGSTADRVLFLQRAAAFRKVYDPSTGFMRGKRADGSWVTPFNPLHLTNRQHEYTEGNAWQHTWFVPHDVEGLIELMGGRQAFVRKLEELFSQPSKIDDPEAPPDVSGLIGQYAHGNEPSHHVAYLYNYAGEPWRTQQRVRQITRTLYDKSREGLCGNEDCGQMSAWYVFSALGLYPVNPAEGIYSIGSPHFDRVEVDLARGRKFVITARGASDANIYVHSARLNGRPLDRCWIRHEEIVRGGELTFEVGPGPDKGWAAGAGAAPPSMSRPRP